MAHPHCCTIRQLQRVERSYKQGRISEQLYDEWMSINGGDYQLGTSAVAFRLWDAFRDANIAREVEDLWQPSYSECAAVELYECRHHKQWRVRILWDQVTNRRLLKPVNDLWPYSSLADKRNSVLDVASVLFHAKRAGMTKAVDAMLPFCSPRLPNVTIVCLLLHAIGNPEVAPMLSTMREYTMCCLNEEDYSKLFKSLSVAIRRTSRWPSGRRANLAEVACAGYWEIATGRSRNLSDWTEEKRKRTEQVVWLCPPEHVGPRTEASNRAYLADLTPILVDIMRELVADTQMQESYPEFVRKRQMWVSSGSTGGESFELDGKKHRACKHTFFETIPAAEMDTWIETEPIIQATASEKFEMGKDRAIYGTEVLSYVLMSYCIMLAERRLYTVDGVESGLTGVDEIATILRRKMHVQEAGAECTMVDYVDFNYQHTLAALTLLFEFLAQRYEEINAHPDLIRATRWCARALSNQYCRFPNDSRNYRITQGMFSGVRGTNFINTLLNVAYYRMARQHACVRFNLKAEAEFTVHQGDDVWISNRSRLWAIVLFTLLQASGLQFHPAKQLFDKNKGEFLRVLYTAAGLRGFLARAVPTFVMKPLQGADATSPAERASALSAQLNVLVRRGFSSEAANFLWQATVPYAASSQIGGVMLQIPPGILKKSYLDGGLDIGPPHTMAVRTVTTAPVPTVVSGSPRMAEVLPAHMSRDWIVCMSKTIKQPFNAESIQTMLHEANMCDSLRDEDKQRILRKLAGQIAVWRAQLVSEKDDRSKPLFDEYMSGEGTMQANRQMALFAEAAISPKRGVKKTTDVQTLMRAVAMSPFRDLSTATSATGQDTLSCLRLCILLCPHPTLAASAMNVADKLERHFSPDVFRRILAGLRLGGTTFECIYHPIIMSWAQQLALQAAIDELLEAPLINICDWDNTLQRQMQTMVRTLDQHSILAHISAY